MASSGIWSLKGTPGILEVYNYVDSTLEDKGDEGSTTKRAEVASKLLETLEKFNYDETTEPADSYISDWLGGEEKVIDLPIYEDFPLSQPSIVQPGSATVVQPNSASIVPQGHGQGHVKVGYEASPVWQADEYSSLYSPPAAQWPVYNEMVAAVSSQLTPPHSPNMYELSPKHAAEFKDLADDLMKPAAGKLPPYPSDIGLQATSPCLLPPQPDYEENLKDGGQLILSLLAEMNPKDISELVQANELIQDQGQTSEPYTVPDLSAPASSGANMNYSEVILSPDHSCSSDSNFDYTSDTSSDPDYIPSARVGFPRKPRAPEVASGKIGSARKETKRAKPYARKAALPIEDKRLRKKEQNKNAATRYRIKKKAEIEEVLGEEKELLEKNAQLQKSVEDLSREIKFMKKFMRDFFKKQGVLK
ncbi:hypothetical protein M8J76_015169 [Diaphorina citri]|nr:hypothetical protein M8J76_015169 [Diaphorina citri]